MFAECRKQPGDLVIYGCTFLPAPGRTALILLNADQDEGERACTLIYEKAHLPPNNWLDAAMEARSPDAKDSEPESFPLPGYVTDLRAPTNQWMPALNASLAPERSLQLEGGFTDMLNNPAITATDQIAQSELTVISGPGVVVVTPVSKK